MGWRTVIVNKHSKLSYRNNHLVFQSMDQIEQIHLSEIDVLLLETTDILITTMLLKCLIDENVLILFCDDKRLPIGKVLPFYGRHDSSMQLQRQMNWCQTIKSNVWTQVIRQKIKNQQIFLATEQLISQSEAINKLINELENLDPSNREGHAARIYFHALFGNQFTREDKTDVNSALNYGYTFLLSMVAREIVKNGCMTQFGLKHHNQFNDFNLASDLMEPFRIIVDQIVYKQQQKPYIKIKIALFELFTTTYLYEGKQMFLTNIIDHYVRNIIKTLNGDRKEVPIFKI